MATADVSARLAEVRAVVAEAAARAGRDAREVTVVAVTKGMGAERVREAVAAGLTILGENRIQEAVPKIEAIGNDTDLSWHLIGHLQRNKVKFVEGRFSMVQSVDSLELVRALERRLTSPLEVLIEVNLAAEPQKTGALSADVFPMAAAMVASARLRLLGLMTIAPQSADPELARPYSRRLATVGRELADRLGVRLPVLSMGMTDDYSVAVEEGSTMLRLGRALFGSR